MKKLANFSATHGTERGEVSIYYEKDGTLAHFLNGLDKRYFCFHNILNYEYCQKFALNVKKNLKNVEFLLYKTPSFNLAFAAHLTSLQEKGYTDIVYLPDDAACVTKRKDLLNEVLKVYRKNKDITFLSLCIKSSELAQKNILPEKTLHISKNVVASFYTPTVFKDTTLLDIINKPFIANINYLLKICDKTYSELATKNEGDLYMRSQFLKEDLFKITCLNFRLFRCFYYVTDQKYKRLRELHLMRKLLQHKKHLV